MRDIIPPSDASHLSRKQIRQFEQFLTDRGSEIHAPTSPYEFWRFLDHEGRIASVYQNTSGRLSWSNNAAAAWRAYKGATPWRSLPKANRKTHPRERTYKNLVERDGDACFFCARPVPYQEYTCEHLLPVTCGGPSRLANYAIAHKRCNVAAGSMSLVEKMQHAITVRLREKEFGE